VEKVNKGVRRTPLPSVDNPKLALIPFSQFGEKGSRIEVLLLSLAA
jgi:hypothetical protein